MSIRFIVRDRSMMPGWVHDELWAGAMDSKRIWFQLEMNHRTDVRMLRVGLFNCLLLDHEIFALFDSFLSTLIRKSTRRLSLLLWGWVGKAEKLFSAMVWHYDGRSICILTFSFPIRILYLSHILIPSPHSQITNFVLMPWPFVFVWSNSAK